MNDIYSNPYVKRRIINVKDYTLGTFLFDEIAVERERDVNDIMLAIGNLLILHGFNINLLGYRYLIMLCTRYIVKSDYDEPAALSEIADVCGTTEKFIENCITACLRYNPSFADSAAISLNCSIDFDRANTIGGAVEIIGALFKIYYNYTVVSEEIEETHAINYNRIDLKNG